MRSFHADPAPVLSGYALWIGPLPTCAGTGRLKGYRCFPPASWLRKRPNRPFILLN